MLYVNEKLKKEATLCNKKFGCLAGGEQKLCKVVSRIDNKFYSILCDKANQNGCFYKQIFVGGTLCACPVRKEIYEKYRL